MLLVVAGCNDDPLGDDIDLINEETSIVKTLTYTLTEDDYETADDACSCSGFGNFSSQDGVEVGVAAVLASKFPALGNKSSAVVTYDFYRGPESGISGFTEADTYSLDSDDYASVTAVAEYDGFFNNTFESGDYLPDIIDANVGSPVDGDFIAVTYDFAEFEYEDVNYRRLYEEDFQSYVIDVDDLDAFQVFSDEGDQGWYLYSSSAGYQAARMGGFANGVNNPNMDRLILPEIDLAGINDPIFKLSHVVNFLGSSVYETDIAVMISTDYDGIDPSIATWTNLSLDEWPVGNSYDILDSEASLAAYAGQQIYISFYYKSTVDYSSQWRVISILVDEGEPFDVDTRNEFFQYSSSSSEWESAGDGVYFLSSADYDAMGSPGQQDQFSSSTSADDYLPAFLKIKYPFAQEEDELSVIYKYNSSFSGLGTRGDFYTYTSGVWVEYATVIEESLGFGHNGDVWVPDNTIAYTLGSADYAAVAAAYETTNSAGSSSMSSFGNYDVGLWSFEEIFESISDRLPVIFPGSDECQKYLVTYATWEPGNGTGEIHYILSGGEYILFDEKNPPAACQ